MSLKLIYTWLNHTVNSTKCKLTWPILVYFLIIWRDATSFDHNFNHFMQDGGTAVIESAIASVLKEKGPNSSVNNDQELQSSMSSVLSNNWLLVWCHIICL